MWLNSNLYTRFRRSYGTEYLLTRCCEFKSALAPKFTYEPLAFLKIALMDSRLRRSSLFQKHQKVRSEGSMILARGLVPNKPMRTKARSLEDLRGERAAVSTTSISVGVAFGKITGQSPQKPSLSKKLATRVPATSHPVADPVRTGTSWEARF
jgi:hypothetical protein